MDLQLGGKLAVVTGASRGIGAAVGAALAREGCEVALVARSAERLEEAATEIRRASGRVVHTLAVDLGQPGATDRVAQEWGSADVLVNNAGAIPGGRLEEVGPEVWRRAWDLKVFGYIDLTRHLVNAMGARGSGVVVNVIGAAAQTRDPAYVCGVTANAALTAFTMSVGSDSPRRGVRVVGVSPGPVATERLAALEAAGADVAGRPFGRAASTDEIAHAVTFLASPLSGYTSGTVLTVDGGLSARAASV